MSYLFLLVLTGQALKWIKNMESSRGLKIIDLQMSDYMRTLEQCVQYGFPVVLQNVQERLDPSLDSILNKAIIKIGTYPLTYLLKKLSGPTEI